MFDNFFLLHVGHHLWSWSQSASLSWCRAPIWSRWPDLYFMSDNVGVLMWGVLSNERWVCNLLVQLLLGLVRPITLGSKSGRTHNHILLLTWDSPKQESLVPVFISAMNRVAQLCTWALCSPVVTYYDSQGAPLWRETGQSQSQSHFMSVSQYVLVLSPLCGRLTRYYIPFM
jgi:hypothetical protein